MTADEPIIISNPAILVRCPLCRESITLNAKITPRLTHNENGRKGFLTADIGCSGIEHTCEPGAPTDNRVRVTRNPTCVEQWPECEDGAYHPSCCRFPKSCSCNVYDAAPVAGDQRHHWPTPPRNPSASSGG